MKAGPFHLGRLVGPPYSLVRPPALVVSLCRFTVGRGRGLRLEELTLLVASAVGTQLSPLTEALPLVGDNLLHSEHCSSQFAICRPCSCSL